MRWFFVDRMDYFSHATAERRAFGERSKKFWEDYRSGCVLLGVVTKGTWPTLFRTPFISPEVGCDPLTAISGPIRLCPPGVGR